jgi:hypothetical protein
MIEGVNSSLGLIKKMMALTTMAAVTLGTHPADVSQSPVERE